MSGKNRSEVVSEIEGELRRPDLSEDFKVHYRVTVSKNENQPLSAEMLGEQILKVIEKDGL